jgi:hypothetical protein
MLRPRDEGFVKRKRQAAKARAQRKRNRSRAAPRVHVKGTKVADRRLWSEN